MQITKMRLLGFKSFVEPTELLIEGGLTGVVGPNGCGKSNLLEALRWSMGETSYKSMRASSMDDVIFNGTNQRPARNMAEVTLFIDNSKRTAPAEFNDHDVLEITRRIEREMGSAYRVNGREVRARDVKILFDDAATGARSPALVRQGQIGEIVNSKPEQRRRILEDAAGIAGLHTRRHEAELRLKAAEANLARVHDVLGQLNSQLESLKRQARQARRYKELSGDIRSAEALLLHAQWVAIEADVNAAESQLGEALSAVAEATEFEATLVLAEHAAASALPALRQVEAERAAALQRVRIEQDNLERELARTAARRKELEDRTAQAKRDLQREENLAAEAKDTLARLAHEKKDIETADRHAADFEARAAAALTAADLAAKSMEQRLAGLQMAAAEARARRKSFEQQKAERVELTTRLQRQVAVLETQLREAVATAPEAAMLRATADLGQSLMARSSDLDAQLEAAEEQVLIAADEARRAREAAAAAALDDKRLETEIETLGKLLPTDHDHDAPAIFEQVTVAPGFELALGAALGDDLDAPLSESAPTHWRSITIAASDPALPEGTDLLADQVDAPDELARRLSQIGIVAPVDGPRLQKQLAPGQRLVSREGHLWRWDGLVAAPGASTAGQRLVERNRLDQLSADHQVARATLARLAAAQSKAHDAHTAAEATVRRLRQEVRETQTELATTRQTLTLLERQARETEQKVASLTEARNAAGDALVEANERLAEVDMALEGLSDSDMFEDQLSAALDEAAEKRAAVAEAKNDITTLEREHRLRAERLAILTTEIDRWQGRSETAAERIAALGERIMAAEEELLADTADPADADAKRQTLLGLIAEAEQARKGAADALAEADTRFRETQSGLRAAQSAIGTAREGKARAETRLEAARQRRIEHARKAQDAVGVLPDGCLGLTQHPAGAPVPPAADLETTLSKLKAERERLGGVNLAADDDLAAAQGQFDGLDKERADVEEAIAKLRGGIAELNKEAKGRLDTAFETVNGHFQRLFGILFGGGEARLEMIQSPDDPLEGGLEIIAKPPGKKPATLSLLSGGEQTLTALSLIFAVFLTNPSPICVLDEVDAPLDDSNVDRFCTLMERMASETDTRFLVITHHPMTMARMNRLFGVTMAEKGVSQLVSVDLEAARRFVEADAA